MLFQNNSIGICTGKAIGMVVNLHIDVSLHIPVCSPIEFIHRTHTQLR
jgi:hypothetical protein